VIELTPKGLRLATNSWEKATRHVARPAANLDLYRSIYWTRILLGLLVQLLSQCDFALYEWADPSLFTAEDSDLNFLVADLSQLASRILYKMPGKYCGRFGTVPTTYRGRQSRRQFWGA
jgi:hypothetical protein